MLLDTHLHTKEYSPDSFLPVRDAVNRARSMGLSGLCVTDHDSMGIRAEVEALRHECSFPIFVGCEVLTQSGDFVVFGLDHEPYLPAASELIAMVRECSGAAIAAHPYRNNGRGAGELINTLEGLDGVECFNGSTKPEANMRAFREAKSRGLACLGASDAHLVERVGIFATLFHGEANNEQELISLIKAGACEPLAWDGKTFKEVTLS
ncbi:MAG: PHP domain-containing protein [Synergistaceae bacterium]|nr:PHP domain-containing protein [Synergistaceae bacterium]